MSKRSNVRSGGKTNQIRKPKKAAIPKGTAKGIGVKSIEKFEKARKSVYNLRTEATKLGVSLNVETVGVTSFKDIKELNQYVRSVKNQIAEGVTVTNKEGVTAPLKEVRKLKNLFGHIERVKEKELERISQIKVVAGGQQLTTSAAVQEWLRNKQGELSVPTFTMNRFRSKKAFNDYLMKMTAEYSGDFLTRQREEYRRRFLKALDTQFGEELGEEAIEGFKKHIEDMNLQKFIDTYYGDVDANIRYIYDKADAAARLKRLKEMFGMQGENE